MSCIDSCKRKAIERWWQFPRCPIFMTVYCIRSVEGEGTRWSKQSDFSFFLSVVPMRKSTMERYMEPAIHGTENGTEKFKK